MENRNPKWPKMYSNRNTDFRSLKENSNPRMFKWNIIITGLSILEEKFIEIKKIFFQLVKRISIRRKQGIRDFRYFKLKNQRRF